MSAFEDFIKAGSTGKPSTTPQTEGGETKSAFNSFLEAGNVKPIAPKPRPIETPQVEQPSIIQKIGKGIKTFFLGEEPKQIDDEIIVNQAQILNEQLNQQIIQNQQEIDNFIDDGTYQSGKIKKDLRNTQYTLEKAKQRTDEILGYESANKGFFRQLAQGVKDFDFTLPISATNYQEWLPKNQATAYQKLENNEELTSQDLAVLTAYRAELFNNLVDKGLGTQAGDVITGTLTFGAEMYAVGMATGGNAIKPNLSPILKKIPSQKAQKVIGNIANNLIGKSVQAQFDIPTIEAKTAQYMLPSADYEKYFREAGQDDDILNYLNQGDDETTARYKAIATNTVEYASEAVGTIIDDATPFVKKAIVGKYLKNKNINPKNINQVRNTLKGLSINNILGEVIEEETGEPIISLIEGEEYKNPFTTPEGRERLLVTVLGIAPLQGISTLSDVRISDFKRNKQQKDTPTIQIPVEDVDAVTEDYVKETKTPTAPREPIGVPQNKPQVPTVLDVTQKPAPSIAETPTQIAPTPVSTTEQVTAPTPTPTPTPQPTQVQAPAVEQPRRVVEPTAPPTPEVDTQTQSNLDVVDAEIESYKKIYSKEPSKLKGALLEMSALKRKLTGKPTKGEIDTELKRLNTLFKGREVRYNNKDYKVVNRAFNNVKIADSAGNELSVKVNQLQLTEPNRQDAINSLKDSAVKEVENIRKIKEETKKRRTKKEVEKKKVEPKKEVTKEKKPEPKKEVKKAEPKPKKKLGEKKKVEPKTKSYTKADELRTQQIQDIVYEIKQNKDEVKEYIKMYGKRSGKDYKLSVRKNIDVLIDKLARHYNVKRSIVRTAVYDKLDVLNKATEPETVNNILTKKIESEIQDIKDTNKKGIRDYKKIKQLEDVINKQIQQGGDEVDMILGEIYTEFEASEAGYRVWTWVEGQSDPIITGKQSSFPDYLPDELKRKVLLEKIIDETVGFRNFTLPKGNKTRERSLYFTVLEMASGAETVNISKELDTLIDEFDKPEKIITTSYDGSKRSLESKNTIKENTAGMQDKYLKKPNEVYGALSEIFKGIENKSFNWLPKELQDIKLLNKVMENIATIETMQYPEGNKPAQRQLYNYLFNEIDRIAGIDTSDERANILNEYKDSQATAKTSIARAEKPAKPKTETKVRAEKKVAPKKVEKKPEDITDEDIDRYIETGEQRFREVPETEKNPIVNQKTGETLNQAIEKLRNYGWSEKDITGYRNAILGIPNDVAENKITKTTKPITVYHVTSFDNKEKILKEGFKKGSELPEDSFRGGGYGEIQDSISFTENAKIASAFALSPTNTIFEVELKPNITLMEREDIDYAEELNQEIPDLLKQGIDAVKIYNGEEEVVVINKNAIKKINRTVDFKQKDSMNILSLLGISKDTREVPEADAELLQEARKYKSAEEFIKKYTLDSQLPSVARYIQKIPLNRIQGTDYIELDKALKTGRSIEKKELERIISPTDDFIKGKSVIKAIELISNGDGTYSVMGGNHRLAQALLNGDKDILSYVEGESKGTSLTDIWNQAQQPTQIKYRTPNLPFLSDNDTNRDSVIEMNMYFESTNEVLKDRANDINTILTIDTLNIYDRKIIEAVSYSRELVRQIFRGVYTQKQAIERADRIINNYRKRVLEKYRVAEDVKAITGKDINKNQEQELIDLNKRFFGDDNVRLTLEIITNKQALGAYYDNIIEIVKGQANPKDTFLHEAVHKYIRTFSGKQEIRDLFRAGMVKYNTTDLSVVEERIAEDFIQYYKDKQPKNVKDKVLQIIQRLAERINIYTKNRDEIETLYDNIISGKAKEITKKKAKPTKKKAGVSAFQQRVSEQLLSTDPSRHVLDERLGTYDRKSLEVSAKQASDYLEKNPKEALAVALGIKQAPENMEETAIAVATAYKAKQEGDLALWADIINHTSQRLTRLGREIVQVRGTFTDDSPENYIRKVIDKRTNTLGLVYLDRAKLKLQGGNVKDAVNDKITKDAKKLKERLTIEQTKIASAQSLIDSLRC